MKVRSHSLSPSVARGIAVMCAVFFGAGVFKSTDGATNWRTVNAGLTGGVTVLAIDPTTPSTLYAGTQYGAGVFKSTDGANSWQSTRVSPNRSQRVLATAPPAAV